MKPMTELMAAERLLRCTLELAVNRSDPGLNLTLGAVHWSLGIVTAESHYFEQLLQSCAAVETMRYKPLAVRILN